MHIFYTYIHMKLCLVFFMGGSSDSSWNPSLEIPQTCWSQEQGRQEKTCFNKNPRAWILWWAKYCQGRRQLFQEPGMRTSHVLRHEGGWTAWTAMGYGPKSVQWANLVCDFLKLRFCSSIILQVPTFVTSILQLSDRLHQDTIMQISTILQYFRVLLLHCRRPKPAGMRRGLLTPFIPNFCVMQLLISVLEKHLKEGEYSKNKD